MGIHAKIYVGIRYRTLDQHLVLTPRCFNNENLAGARDNVNPKRIQKEEKKFCNHGRAVARPNFLCSPQYLPPSRGLERCSPETGGSC